MEEGNTRFADHTGKHRIEHEQQQGENECNEPRLAHPRKEDHKPDERDDHDAGGKNGDFIGSRQVFFFLRGIRIRFHSFPDSDAKRSRKDGLEIRTTGKGQNEEEAGKGTAAKAFHDRSVDNVTRRLPIADGEDGEQEVGETDGKGDFGAHEVGDADECEEDGLPLKRPVVIDLFDDGHVRV